MNSDQNLIQSAYENAIRRIYDKLIDQYTEAAGDPAQEQEADRHFSTGVSTARRARDRAIALLA